MVLWELLAGKVPLEATVAVAALNGQDVLLVHHLAMQQVVSHHILFVNMLTSLPNRSLELQYLLCCYTGCQVSAGVLDCLSLVC